MAEPELERVRQRARALAARSLALPAEHRALLDSLLPLLGQDRALALAEQAARAQEPLLPMPLPAGRP